MNTYAQDPMIVRGLILDMDGVLWQEDQPIGDLRSIFSEITRRGLKVVLATNNSTKTVHQYLAKLRLFGVELQNWQIITSALATANYLRKFFSKGGPVFVIGEHGLIQSLEEQGFHHNDSGGNEQVLAVIVGLDRSLTYEKLKIAMRYIECGAKFIATNKDNTLPVPGGPVPGAGSIVAAVETATGQRATVIGKPEPEMYRWAIELMGITPKDTLVIGDRLETDIAGAQTMECQSGLVLSGVTTSEQAVHWTPKPDRVAKDLGSMLRDLWKE